MAHVPVIFCFERSHHCYRRKALIKRQIQDTFEANIRRKWMNENELNWTPVLTTYLLHTELARLTYSFHEKLHGPLYIVWSISKSDKLSKSFFDLNMKSSACIWNRKSDLKQSVPTQRESWETHRQTDRLQTQREGEVTNQIKMISHIISN